MSPRSVITGGRRRVGVAASWRRRCTSPSSSRSSTPCRGSGRCSRPTPSASTVDRDRDPRPRRRRSPRPAGALVSAGALAGLALSSTVGLFGWQEAILRPAVRDRDRLRAARGGRAGAAGAAGAARGSPPRRARALAGGGLRRRRGAARRRRRARSGATPAGCSGCSWRWPRVCLALAVRLALRAWTAGPGPPCSALAACRSRATSSAARRACRATRTTSATGPTRSGSRRSPSRPPVAARRDGLDVNCGGSEVSTPWRRPTSYSRVGRVTRLDLALR